LFLQCLKFEGVNDRFARSQSEANALAKNSAIAGPAKGKPADTAGGCADA